MSVRLDARFGGGIVLGLVIGVGAMAIPALSSGSAAVPCTTQKKFVECTVGKGVEFGMKVPALDLGCVVMPAPPTAGGQIVACNRLSRRNVNCVEGTVGSLTLLIVRDKMAFLFPDKCKPAGNKAGYEITSAGGHSGDFARTP